MNRFLDLATSFPAQAFLVLILFSATAWQAARTRSVAQANAQPERPVVRARGPIGVAFVAALAALTQIGNRYNDQQRSGRRAAESQREMQALREQARRLQVPLGPLQIGWTLATPLGSAPPNRHAMGGPMLILADGRPIPAAATLLDLRIWRAHDGPCAWSASDDSATYHLVVPNNREAQWSITRDARALEAAFAEDARVVEAGSAFTSAFDLDSACVNGFQYVEPAAPIPERQRVPEAEGRTPLYIRDLRITLAGRSWMVQPMPANDHPEALIGRLIRDLP